MKILLLHQGLQSFVAKDLNILRSAHDVRDICYRGASDVPVVLSGTCWADATFSWFGKLHAFFGVLFSKRMGKKAIVVAGGDDVANEPSIGYGMFAHWWKKWCPLFVFRRADLALCVSQYNLRETLQNARAAPTKVRLLYHGFDAQEWNVAPGLSRCSNVLTVGSISRETLAKKGLAVFVQTARYLPDTRFALVGPWRDAAVDGLNAIAPPNVSLKGALYGRDLLRAYATAKAYIQPSLHESFGCSVAEAMLCECVPVVSRRAALPEVAGDCGLYVDELTPGALAARIEEALALGPEWGQRARQRIADVFPLDKRRDALLAAIEELSP